MELQGERHIPASVEKTWNALNDPDTLKQCITGCESLERTGDNEYLAVLGLKIGPVNAKFKGKLQLTDIVPMESYRILFEGQGGVAGFGKGHADVRLSPDGEATLLTYDAEAQVGGKRVILVRHSQPVRATIEFCNLVAELGDPLVIPATEAG